ncbi:MAG: 6,7-dimethyl-8-ribityllumazine synthase [Patescibacteria group bacterium]
MPIKICIIGGEFHKKITEEMLQYAEDIAPKLEANIKKVIWVPGSLEVPLIVKEVLESGKYNAIVLLGFIEKGETLHGEVIGHQVIKKILDLQLEYRTPIGVGIIGPGATIEQAKARTKEFAEKAMAAAVKMRRLLGQISDS